MGQPDDKHPAYVEMLPVWETCRAAAQGQRAIRKGRTKYLPSLTGQSETAYQAYLQRASWFPAMGRTLEGLVGLAFRKDPVAEYPAGMEAWIKDITMSGKSIDGLARECVTETLKVRRIGLLIDHPPAIEAGQGASPTQAQVEKLGLRPYISIYKAEAIINWYAARIGNVTKLAQVFLTESYQTDDGEKTQVRELTIMDGTYRQIIWRRANDSASWEIHNTITPTKNSAVLTEIPFKFIGTEEPTGQIVDPPLEGLAELNVSHFCNSADYENGIHVAGLPTPVIIGADTVTDEQGNTSYTEVNLGANTCIMLPMGADAKFLQVEGSFEPLKDALQHKEELMALLGARIIAPEKRQAETAETTTVKKGAETSVLSELVGLVSTQLAQALQMVAEWGGLKGEVKYELNRDYVVSQMTPQEMDALLKALLAGKISHQTYFNCLVAGEVISEDQTFEDEKSQIEEDGPALGTMGDDDAE